MNLVADESIERIIVDRLRLDGHEIFSIAESRPSVTDDAVLAEAAQRNAILLTADKDFGELVYRLRRVNSGVVLTRLAGVSNETKADVVSITFRDHASELQGAFCVITPHSIRVRKKMTLP